MAHLPKLPGSPRFPGYWNARKKTIDVKTKQSRKVIRSLQQLHLRLFPSRQNSLSLPPSPRYSHFGCVCSRKTSNQFSIPFQVAYFLLRLARNGLAWGRRAGRSENCVRRGPTTTFNGPTNNSHDIQLNAKDLLVNSRKKTGRRLEEEQKRRRVQKKKKKTDVERRTSAVDWASRSSDVPSIRQRGTLERAIDTHNATTNPDRRAKLSQSICLRVSTEEVLDSVRE